MKRSLFALTAAGLLFTACSKNKNSSPAGNTDTTYTGYYFNVDKDYTHYAIKEATVGKRTVASMSGRQLTGYDSTYEVVLDATGDITKLYIAFAQWPDGSYHIDSEGAYSILEAIDASSFSGYHKIYMNARGTVSVQHMGTDYIEGSFNAIFDYAAGGDKKRVGGSFKVKANN